MKKTILAAVAALVVAPSGASAAGVDYPDGSWYQATITEADGTVLHTDILRPKGDDLTEKDKTPVILSIGPYFNHSGQLGPAGPAENEATYDPVGPSAGPSERFADFVEGSGLLKKGYSFMMVDLRGYGGSSGCEDWGGPGEQSDVKSAIEWAASQPWSTGAVGTYGKSYDAMTGLIAADLQPKGLKAVVSQEPVYDDYRYLYGDGMRRSNFAGTPGLYGAIAATPGPIADTDPTYNVNGANDVDPNHPGCKGESVAEQSSNSDHYSSYWRTRDFIAHAKGSTVPLFLTQGLTENNTVSDGLAQYLANHAGPERGWLGPWEHVRGNETCISGDVSTGCTTKNIGQLKMGRAGWFDEVLAFYDQYLKGGATDTYPNFEVQTNDGKWRSESQWPPADASDYTSPLNAGTYTDNASGTVTSTAGVWTFSRPLPYAAHLSGSGTINLDLGEQYPQGNLAVDVYDLSASGTSWKGALITRQAHLIYNNGPVQLKLWSADWKLKKGDRIGIKVTDDNTDWWGDAEGLGQTINVFGGSVTLPFLAYTRTQNAQGNPGVQLSSYLSSNTVTLPTATVTGGESTGFVLPPAQQPQP